MENIRVFFINAKAKNSQTIEIIPDLSNYYHFIDCQHIDIVTRKIGDKFFDIICDDEALFVENPQPTAIDSNGNSMLYGNLIICGIADKNGDETSLTDNDIALIKQNMFCEQMLICEYE